jgi:hypothetical protein
LWQQKPLDTRLEQALQMGELMGQTKAFTRGAARCPAAKAQALAMIHENKSITYANRLIIGEGAAQPPFDHQALGPCVPGGPALWCHSSFEDSCSVRQ